MRIQDARVFICSPGRNFVTLKIYTDEGVYGLGDCTLNVRELAVPATLPITSSPASLAVIHFRRKTFGSIYIAGPIGARVGDHERHRCRGHGPVGHQRKSAEHTAVQFAGRKKSARA
jgi:L-alanine-DL-glutamate epimerase-like enolase superfamily enzyme